MALVVGSGSGMNMVDGSGSIVGVGSSIGSMVGLGSGSVAGSVSGSMVRGWWFPPPLFAVGEVGSTVQEHPLHILGKCPVMTFSGQAYLQSLIKAGIVGHTRTLLLVQEEKLHRW